MSVLLYPVRDEEEEWKTGAGGLVSVPVSLDEAVLVDEEDGDLDVLAGEAEEEDTVRDWAEVCAPMPVLENSTKR